MITIIHGDDIASSRNYLQTIKEKFPESRTIAGPAVDLTLLAQLFDSDNLFTTTKTVIIEELLTKKKQASEFSYLLEAINKHSADNAIYLWESKEVAKTIVNKFPGAQNQLYKLPQSLFQFLDSISPKNKKQALVLFHKTIITTEQELIFYMLIRHFRLMLALYDSEAAIDEVKRMSPWQKDKIKRQAALFSKEELSEAMQQLHIIDFEQKTGATPSALSASIDIFLLNL